MPRNRLSKDWPAWRYGPLGESGIYNCEEEVPYGWTKRPGEVFVPKPGPELLDRADLERQLEAKGITPNPTWSARHMKDLLTK